MTKSQILILLLIIALAFYWSAENQPKTSPKIKKPIRPQLPKSTSVILPAAEPINLPNTKIKELLNQGWPAHFPVHNFPSATWVEEPENNQAPEPTKFQGLNPPHSQVVEPFEPPKPPNEPEPKTLNHPAAEFIQVPNNSLNQSKLTQAEKAQRLTQEQADYHWLLNHRTIDYWHHESQLTNSQYQVLASLVGYEEMNTLSHFLNLLPTNYEWLLISSEFKTQPALIEQWKPNFTYQQTQDWLKIGLQPTDYALATWLQNTKHLTPEEALNTQDFEQLKAEFSHYAS